MIQLDNLESRRKISAYEEYTVKLLMCMKPFIRLLKEAGENERVVSIRMILYRVAKNSQIVEALIDAAENGKEVVVLVELRARIDEENNIEWSRRLEDAGCRIYCICGFYDQKYNKAC